MKKYQNIHRSKLIISLFFYVGYVTTDGIDANKSATAIVDIRALGTMAAAASGQLAGFKKLERKITIEIIYQGADYLLVLKGNQETLHDEVEAFFEDPESLKYAEEKGAVVETVEDHDRGHGRIEKRICTVTDYLSWLPAKVRRDCAENLSPLRRLALNLLKIEPSKPKEPIRGKRIYAVLDQDYLESIIGLAQVCALAGDRQSLDFGALIPKSPIRCALVGLIETAEAFFGQPLARS